MTNLKLNLVKQKEEVEEKPAEQKEEPEGGEATQDEAVKQEETKVNVSEEIAAEKVRRCIR